MKQQTIVTLQELAQDLQMRGDARGERVGSSLSAYQSGNLKQAYDAARPLADDDTLGSTERAALWTLLMHAATSDAQQDEAVGKVLELNPANDEAQTLAEANRDRNEPRVEGGARVYNAGTYQMLWDCPFCGSDKLLGLTHRFCPNCGAAQDPDARYFPSEEDKVAVENHRFIGADKTCPACDTANAATATFCQQCGSPLDGAEQVALQHEQPSDDAPPPPPSSSSALAGSGGGGGGSKRPLWIGGAVVAVIAVIAVFFLWTQEVAVQVTAYGWERTVAVERFEPRSDDSWCDAMPRDAYSVRRSREIRSYNEYQVRTGEECSVRNVDNGDGTFRQERVCTDTYRTEREPVYDDFCDYTVDRWGFER
ncbi:MAG: zinc ribbon domain-containing protein, partial [Trueperaceae bacterium]|nr:zinc ribbon domain-containing protein [Trueperaceae bacterium]